MGLWSSVSGLVSVEIVSPSVTEIITKIGKTEILLENIVVQSDMIANCYVRRTDYAALSRLIDKNGCEMRLLKRSGLYWSFHQVLTRPVFLVGIMMLAFLSLYIPTRVLFVNVEGNENLSSYRILEAAQQCGISFGASRRNVRSEQMKNALLDALPQLQWAGVNTYGCVAVITVQERSDTSESEIDSSVSNIVSTQDGIISSITVKEGTPLCSVGQAVKKGDKLVSGYTDCGRVIRAQRSEGEVYAYTIRKLTAVFPTERLKKAQVYETKANISLIIGKKLINLSQDSGISSTSCDKIYKMITLTLPGGFELPVSVLYTQYIFREKESSEAEQIDIDELVTEYLRDNMVAGDILNSHSISAKDQGTVILNGIYFCNEMIGKEQIEEHYKGYG